jgi:N-acetylglutamate synthase-like GNAT family acetyltransferase
VTDLPILGRNALDGIASLCERAVANAPSADELELALFAPEQPAVIRGDPSVGVVATVACDDGAHVRLLAVDPDHRGQGRGHGLLEAAEGDARAQRQRSLTTGADAPFFLWPGVPSTATAMLCLLERHRYSRVEINFDMRVELASIPEDPGGYAFAIADERDEVDGWFAKHWANWRLEGLRALNKGNLVLCRDDDGISAICAFEVNRSGFLGPVAVRPDVMGRGRGKPVLLGALHELRRRGRDHVDVCWVGPIPPYAGVGGRVSNVYFVYRRELV